MAANECRSIVHNHALPIASCSESSSYGETEHGHTDGINVLGCVDGTECLASPCANDAGAGVACQDTLPRDPAGWGCCIAHGGRDRCPSNYPVMCNQASTATLISDDYNCEATADDCIGGTRDRIYGETAVQLRAAHYGMQRASL